MLQTLKCRTILGRQNLDFSIDCLRSFITNSIQPIKLEIFQDGTLSDEDKRRLISNLNDCVIIEKKDSNDIALQRLKAYPACLKWRDNNFYSLKFFDIMLYDESNFLYIDTDILFFQRFKFPEFSETPVFMIDNYTTYSFSPFDFLQIKTPIFGNLNAGFNYFPNHLFNLDFIEQLLNDSFLQTCFYGKWCGVSEQTLWAFLAAKQKHIFMFDSKQIIMADKKMKITSEAVAVHLTRPFRNQYSKLKSIEFPKQNPDDYKDVRLNKKSQILGKVSFASEWIRSKFESKLSQFTTL